MHHFSRLFATESPLFQVERKIEEEMTEMQQEEPIAFGLGEDGLH
jgi:translation elongation factor EF-1beta